MGLLYSLLLKQLIASPTDRKMDNVNFIGKNKKLYCPRCKKLTEQKYISEDELKCSECGNISEED